MKMLKGELEMAKGILEGIKVRENIKLRQIEFAINSKALSADEHTKLQLEIKQFLAKPSKPLPQKEPLLEKFIILLTENPSPSEEFGEGNPCSFLRSGREQRIRRGSLPQYTAPRRNTKKSCENPFLI